MDTGSKLVEHVEQIGQAVVGVGSSYRQDQRCWAGQLPYQGWEVAVSAREMVVWSFLQ